MFVTNFMTFNFVTDDGSGLGCMGLIVFYDGKKRHRLHWSVTILKKTSSDLICDAQYMTLPENVMNKIL